MITKKQFKKMAEVIGSAEAAEQDNEFKVMPTVRWAIIDLFRASNPKFDIDKFIEAINEAKKLALAIEQEIGESCE